MVLHLTDTYLAYIVMAYIVMVLHLTDTYLSYV